MKTVLAQTPKALGVAMHPIFLPLRFNGVTIIDTKEEGNQIVTTCTWNSTMEAPVLLKIDSRALTLITLTKNEPVVSPIDCKIGAVEPHPSAPALSFYTMQGVLVVPFELIGIAKQLAGFDLLDILTGKVSAEQFELGFLRAENMMLKKQLASLTLYAEAAKMEAAMSSAALSMLEQATDEILDLINSAPRHFKNFAQVKAFMKHLRALIE